MADLGHRTDVLYKRLLTPELPTRADLSAWLAEGVSWVVIGTESTYASHARAFGVMARADVRWTVTGNVRAQLLRSTKTAPLIGLMAVEHLLKQPIRSLRVFNCDFYQPPTGLASYQQGYEGKHYRQLRGRPEGQAAPVHNVGSQLQYLGRRQIEEPRLSFDDHLQGLVDRAMRGKVSAGVLAVIPARYQSSRFPGKPLAEIAGKPMILHVCDRVVQVIPNLVVATDDHRIASVVEAAGYAAIMTGDCETGTDRVAEVAGRIKAEIYVNVQGDEPLIDPDDIALVIQAKKLFPKAVVNAVAPIDDAAIYDPTVVKAVVSDGRLIYASRAPVPASKDGPAPEWRQLGLYAFTRDDLKAFANHGRRALERTEDVEILRFIEMGQLVRVVALKSVSAAVDLPEHIARIEERLGAREAVLV